VTPQAIYNVVKEHVLAAGYYNRKGEAALAAHDLRRAALALKGGADLSVLLKASSAANPADVGPCQYHNDGTLSGADA
jgi:hypothetical protein